MLALAIYLGDGIPSLLKPMAKTPECFDETCLVLISRLKLQFGSLFGGKYQNLQKNLFRSDGKTINI